MSNVPLRRYWSATDLQINDLLDSGSERVHFEWLGSDKHTFLKTPLTDHGVFCIAGVWVAAVPSGRFGCSPLMSTLGIDISFDSRRRHDDFGDGLFLAAVRTQSLRHSLQRAGFEGRDNGGMDVAFAADRGRVFQTVGGGFQRLTDLFLAAPRGGCGLQLHQHVQRIGAAAKGAKILERDGTARDLLEVIVDVFGAQTTHLPVLVRELEQTPSRQLAKPRQRFGQTRIGENLFDPLAAFGAKSERDAVLVGMDILSPWTFAKSALRYGEDKLGPNLGGPFILLICYDCGLKKELPCLPKKKVRLHFSKRTIARVKGKSVGKFLLPSLAFGFLELGGQQLGELLQRRPLPFENLWRLPSD